MNTSATITAVGGVIASICTVLVGVFVRRSDRNAKMTQRYFDDLEFNIDMVDAIRVDYWQMYGWANVVSGKWHTLIQGLPSVCAGSEDAVKALMAKVGDLPAMPEAKHLDLERKRIAEIRDGKRSKDKESEE